MTTPQEDYLSCTELACAALDGIEEYGITDGDARGLLVLHGIAMYARDTTRGAASLLRDGQTLAAAALTRVVIEHAVLAQWLKPDPEMRGQLFLQQSEVEHARWYEVVVAAGLGDEASGPENGGLGRKPRNVTPEFDTPKNLFGDAKGGRQMYLTYRNLSRFVHPSVVTFLRYTSRLKFGAQLTTRLQVEQDPEAVSYYLASAMVMCSLPYLDALGEVGAGIRVGVAARTAEVLTSLA